jgi:hypothetical protein
MNTNKHNLKLKPTSQNGYLTKGIDKHYHRQLNSYKKINKSTYYAHPNPSYTHLISQYNPTIYY